MKIAEIRCINPLIPLRYRHKEKQPKTRTSGSNCEASSREKRISD